MKFNVQHIQQCIQHDIEEDARKPASLNLRKRALAAIAGAALAASASLGHAQSYPTHSVKIIVPFGVGGPADIYGRMIAQGLSETLREQFVIEDRPGAGSVTGTDAVAKSPHDGYTLLIISNTHAINETLYPKLPYALERDFAPITQINRMPNVLVVNPRVKVSSVKELIAQAKAQPGKLNYASSGSGTPYHLAAELFKRMAGVDILHVPYRASGDARTAVIAGQVQMMFDALPTTLPQMKAGKMKGLAITSLQRSALLPDLPTMSEAGVPGYEADLWLGLVAPAGTPAKVIDILQEATRKYLNRSDVQKTFAAQGTVPIASTPKEFRAVLTKEIQKWGQVVKFSGAKVD